MKKFIGNKKFYAMVLAIAVPIMIQNGITNFVGLLDNIMVGKVGTEQMSGVAIVNQLLFVFNLCVFGGVSGAGIFGAQFYGQGNQEGVRNAFRYKLIICGIILAVSIMIFLFFGENLISMYLHEGSEVGDITLALQYGEDYMKIMLIGLIPFSLIQVYAGTLRETGQTLLPMLAGILSVIINCTLNYILIFGKFGAPKLGVEGAAIATVIARFIEAAVVILWTHIHHQKNEFIVGAYRTMRIPKELFLMITIKGMPLLVNETLWSAGMATLMQCYSNRGIAVVAGYNISSTISNMFNIVFIAMGSAISIVIGQLLGAGKMEEAKDTAGKMIFFSVIVSLVVGILMGTIAHLFVNIYNTDREVKHLALWFIRITAFMMPLQAFLNASYFTLRSGGKTIITFLFDSCFVWVVSIPAANSLTHLTGLPILWIFLICQSLDSIKCIIGYILLRKGIWLNNIVTS
ncbi:MATE family efflux transporter [Anaerosporobacter faecicola]|uniref:MATE family efflux transporter n=1 Tax=Anaerosporobacter faecicola TaxID=2718714 RepID=UPI00143B8B02|nr:MATE family efflux transporter [Anaerosporobacter faecicola]